MVDVLCPGYEIRVGSSLDRALLVKVMQRTYKELHPHQSVSHLTGTVDQYLSRDTPLRWVYAQENSLVKPELPFSGAGAARSSVGCLWLGDAVDQIEGDRHAYIFLLYVAPDYRRQGIGSALMRRAEKWAQDRGDRKISLQVFSDNQPALEMYNQLGYQTQSFWMTKRLG